MSLRRFFQRRRRSEDLAREIAAHLASERDENQARGMSAHEAERRAHLTFGSKRRVHESLWQQNSIAWLEGLLRDLRYAVRTLTRTPGFTLTVILVIALGVGANIAVFSVMNAVLLKSLPVADPQRVFFLNVDGRPDGTNNSGNEDSAPWIDGHKAPNGEWPQGHTRMNNVASDYFHTLGVPVLAGRDFNDADTPHSAHAVIVNETFAHRFLPGEDPLGHSILDRMMGVDAQIVGVVKDHKYTSITEDPMPMLWMPYTQTSGVGEMHVELRVHGDPLAILPTVQALLRTLDPDLPLLRPMLQQTQFEETISQQTLFARLAECFGLLAVVLVATGLYGTLAYRISSRTPEIGVRMALGAQRSQVIWMVLRGTLLLTGVGLLLGLPLAMLIARSLASSLYHVATTDTISYLVAVLGLAVVALAASALPASRAACIEPMEALRSE